MWFTLLAIAQLPNFPTVINSLVAESTCKASVSQNFGVLLLEKSVNASQQCLRLPTEQVSMFRFNGTELTKCIDESASVVDMFKPSTIGAFDMFTTQEKDVFHRCSDHGLTKSDRSGVWKVASAVVRRFFGCDTSDITDANKKQLTDALVTDTNIVALRALCITIDRGDDSFQAVLTGLTDQIKNLLTLVTNE